MSYYPVRPIRGLSRTIQLLLLGNLVVLSWEFIFVGSKNLEETVDAASQITALERADGALFLLTGVVFIIWFHRAYSNLRAFGLPNLKPSTGWAVGAWFVPVVSFVLPKRIADIVWRASDPSADLAQTNWRRRRLSFVVPIWWLSFVAGSVFDWLALTIDIQDTDSANSAIVLFLLSKPLLIFSAILCAVFVTRVTSRQSRRSVVVHRPRVFSRHSTFDALTAFQDADLPMAGARSIAESEHDTATRLAQQVAIFSVSCLDANGGTGRILSFMDIERLQRGRAHYESKGPAESRVWLFERDNLIVVLDGRVPESEARRFESAMGSLRDR